MNKDRTRLQREASSSRQISLEVYLVYVPISILSTLLSIPNQITQENIVVALYLGVNITALTGLIILTLNSIVNKIDARLDNKKREYIFILILALAGTVRGLLLHYSYPLNGFEQPTGLAMRIFSSTFNFMFWVYLIQKVFQDTRIFNETYRYMIRTAILRIAKEQESKSSKKVERELESELKEIQELISKSIDSVTQSSIQRDDLIRAARQVREVIENKIRPLSHRLWLKSNISVPKLRIRYAVLSSIKNLRIPPIPTALTMAISTAVNLTTNFGLYKGLLSSIFVLVVSITYYRLIDKLSKKVEINNTFLGFCILLFPGVFISTSFYLINTYYYEVNLGPQTLVFIPVCFFIGTCFSIYELNKSDRTAVIQTLENEFQKSIEKSDIQESIAAEKAASYLHNTLQSELLALSYQMDNSAEKSDEVAARSILERLASRINQSIGRDFENFQQNPLDRLRKIQEAWKGIASVEISIPDRLLQDSDRNFLLVQIIEEAIANAIRYQKSNHITVTASDSTSGKTKLSIISEGEAIQGGNPGVGSEWLDRYAAGNWQRKIGGQQTVLEIQL
jgi:hypothetical protein